MIFASDATTPPILRRHCSFIKSVGGILRIVKIAIPFRAVALLMAFASAAPSTSAQDPKRSEIALVESAFVGKSLSEINLALAMVHPAAVSQADKLLLMSDLPFLTAANEIKDKGQLERLRDRVVPVLKLFGRDGVVELVLFRDPRPIVYSKPGVVVALSTEVLKIVGNDDVGLAGIVAHELAHEYVALQMLRAVQAHDLARIRELELFCDTVAVVSLLNLGLDPAHYAKALKDIANHSQAAAVLNDGSNTHPNVEIRLRIISDISAMLKSSPSTDTSVEKVKLVAPWCLFAWEYFPTSRSQQREENDRSPD